MSKQRVTISLGQEWNNTQAMAKKVNMTGTEFLRQLIRLYGEDLVKRMSPNKNNPDRADDE